jgi:hypothetical protein
MAFTNVKQFKGLGVVTPPKAVSATLKTGQVVTSQIQSGVVQAQSALAKLNSQIATLQSQLKKK